MPRKSKPGAIAPIAGDPGQAKSCTDARFIYPDGHIRDSRPMVVFGDGTLDEYCQNYEFGYGWCIWKRQEYSMIDGRPIYKLHAVGKTRSQLGV